MAHEVETMAWTNEVPWHGLGYEVKGDITVDDWLKVAGLDWTLERKPLKVEVEKGNYQNVPGRFAMVRSSDSKVMTVVGQAWKPLQNHQIISFMRDYVAAGGATLETAGSLRGGQIVWGLARLKHEFEVGRGDKVKGYLLITGSHIVGKANTVRTTTVRVVCANTMAAAEQDGTVNYKQNHLTEFDAKAAKKAVGLAHEELVAAEKRAKIIQKLKINTEDAVRKVLVPVFNPELLDDADVMDAIMNPENTPKKISEILQAMDNAPGAIRGNGWGVLNGVTYWADHMQGYGQASRLYRSWIGDYSRRKLEVEKKLLELAE